MRNQHVESGNWRVPFKEGGDINYRSNGDAQFSLRGDRWEDTRRKRTISGLSSPQTSFQDVSEVVYLFWGITIKNFLVF